jgi:hypothetical protein
LQALAEAEEFALTRGKTLVLNPAIRDAAARQQ